MSAWIVTKAHIDALMTAALDYGAINGYGTHKSELDEADKIGAMLWRENHKSVNHRYNENIPVPEYHYQRRAVPLTPVEVVKAVHCLEYQSCEHKGWERSKARKFLQILTNAVLHKLPGYEAAPWGIDS